MFSNIPVGRFSLWLPIQRYGFYMLRKRLKKFDNETICGDQVFYFKTHDRRIRYFVSGFLLLCLCVWAAGEGFLLFIIGSALKGLLAGEAMMGSGTPPTLKQALIGGGFLSIFLVVWSFNGMGLIRQLLKTLRSEDYIVADQNKISIIRRLGSFSSQNQLPREDLRHVYVERKNKNLVAETAKGLTLLTDLGTKEERMAAAEGLQRGLDLSEKVISDTGILPGKWEEIVLPEGNRAVIPNRLTRKKLARLISVIACILLFLALLLVRESLYVPDFWALIVVLLPLAILIAWKVVWFYMGRIEWGIAAGRLTIQKRFGGKVKILMIASALELIEEKDSDGDLWYQLNGIPGDMENSRRGTPGKGKKKLTRSINIPDEPLRLGRWLSSKAGIPLYNDAGLS